MKKLILTISLILGLAVAALADPDGGGLFGRGSGLGGNRNSTPLLPSHELTTNQDSNAPLGSGIALLTALGAAYLAGKCKHKK